MPHPVAAFAPEQERLDALRNGKPVFVKAGDADLGEGIWISCDPQGKTEMAFRPERESFRLSLAGGDTGRWACLGISLPVETLGRGRYLGLWIEAASDALVSFTPTLRYVFREGGRQDTGMPAPMIFPSGRRQDFAHLPIEPDFLGRAERCELHLLFHTDQAAISISRLEPVLMA